jgi:hypothetical protein
MLLALLGGAASPAVVHADAYTYDASYGARVDVRDEIAPASSFSMVGGTLEAYAPSALWTLGATTTPLSGSVATEDGERTYDLRKLGNREFENFLGENAEDVKKDIVGSGGSKFDLYEDKCTGEIFVLRKGGVGEPQPTGYRFPK